MSEIITLENQVLKKLSQLPNNPGVYKFFSPQKKILYIGKAKNISSRTKSYFSNIRNNSNKLKALISEASFLNKAIKKLYVARTRHDNIFKS